MNVRNFGAVALSALTCLLASGTASATTISGAVQINGSGGVQVTATAINFGAGGAFTDTPGLQSGSFAPGTGGTLKNLTGPPLVGAISPAVGTQFATFLGGTTTPIFFDLQFVNPGAGTAAQCAIGTVSSNTCTPAGSPFTLQQIGPTQVLAGLSFSGVSYDITGNPKSPTSGTLSTQFTLQGTIPELLNQLVTNGFLNAQSYSGNFVAVAPPAVPEPSAASLMVAGLGLLASSRLIRKYRR